MILGAIMELILVVTAIGTAIGLFPILRRYGERIARTPQLQVPPTGSLLLALREWTFILGPLLFLGPGLLAAPIAVFEMLLAGWLSVKGFNASTVVSAAARSATRELLAAT